MAVRRTRTRSRSRAPQFVQKPHGVIHPRVQQVGPEHFGIVTVDGAKARSQFMLCDCYGHVRIPPTEVPHNHNALEAAVAQVRQALVTYDLRDVLVAIERTGRYHQVVQRVFRAAGFEVRIVHPFATKQFRQAQDPGNKTDDTDLVALQRAAINGFALTEASLDPAWQEWQLLIRHRRDLVFKTSTLCRQIGEHLDAAWPGYAARFGMLWDSAIPWCLLRQFESAAALHRAGLAGLRTCLRAHGIQFKQPTLVAVLEWAAQAAPGATPTDLHRRLALALDDERQQKAREIQALERELAGRLARTPYLLLLSFPGVNVVSAADFAGEMGPIGNYASARSITGRAGLYPSRYQSDRVDLANGPLVRCANRRLRAAILGIADNLIRSNHHFRHLAHTWQAAGKDPRLTHVKIGVRFCRIAYQIVAGRQLFRHPSVQQRSYVLDQLIAFHREHETPMAQTLADLMSFDDQVR